jgi:hypothetical protein
MLDAADGSALFVVGDRVGVEEGHSLLVGYRMMAADEVREAEAQAWSESMIADGLEGCDG